MVFNFRNPAEGAAYEILLLLVSDEREDGPRLANALSGGDHSVSVEWISADEAAPAAIRRLALSRFLHLPTIVTVDYQSFGNRFRAMLHEIRHALGERYAEFIAINVPGDTTIVTALRNHGVTVLGDCLRGGRTSATGNLLNLA
jgi:hypothetical protein